MSSNGVDRASVLHAVCRAELRADRKVHAEAAVGLQVAAGGRHKLGIRAEGIGVGHIHLVILRDTDVDARSRGLESLAFDSNGVAARVQV